MITPTAKPSGHLLLSVTLYMLLFLAEGAMSAEDMWDDVFTYQRKMAEYGNPEAQVKLGEMYEDGRGTKQDYDEARKWYQKASEQGYSPARDKLIKLEIRRKKETEIRKRAEQERLLQEKAKHERAARAKAEAAEKARVMRERRLAERRKAELEKKQQAEQERLAKERAEQAIKEMLSAPSAYSEED